ncbi:MAG: hypothetical protein QXQ02_08050, partial [Halobacteria archaeon]
KVLMGAIVIGLTSMILQLPLTATPNNCIYGYVTKEDTGQPISGVEILFTLERTHETVATDTDEGGYYYLSK